MEYKGFSLFTYVAHSPTNISFSKKILQNHHHEQSCNVCWRLRPIGEYGEIPHIAYDTQLSHVCMAHNFFF